jgi:hypothetical protein
MGLRPITPGLGLVVVQGTVEGVAFCGIHKGQLAEAELGRGGVCSEAEPASNEA